MRVRVRVRVDPRIVSIDEEVAAPAHRATTATRLHRRLDWTKVVEMWLRVMQGGSSNCTVPYPLSWLVGRTEKR